MRSVAVIGVLQQAPGWRLVESMPLAVGMLEEKQAS